MTKACTYSRHQCLSDIDGFGEFGELLLRQCGCGGEVWLTNHILVVHKNCSNVKQ